MPLQVPLEVHTRCSCTVDSGAGVDEMIGVKELLTFDPSGD